MRDENKIQQDFWFKSSWCWRFALQLAKAGLRRPGAKEQDAQLTEQEAIWLCLVAIRTWNSIQFRMQPLLRFWLHKSQHKRVCQSFWVVPTISYGYSLYFISLCKSYPCILSHWLIDSWQVFEESVRLSRLEFKHKSEAQMVCRLRDDQPLKSRPLHLTSFVWPYDRRQTH